MRLDLRTMKLREYHSLAGIPMLVDARLSLCRLEGSASLSVQAEGPCRAKALQTLDKLAAVGQLHGAPQQTSREARFNSYFRSLTGPGPDTLHRE